jgi:flagellar motor switch protein FliG
VLEITNEPVLSGPQKAAVLVLALGEEASGKLIAGLELQELKELSRAIAELGRVEATVVEQVLTEFGERLQSPSEVAGGLETTEKLLARFLDQEKVAAILDEIRGPAARSVWDGLGKVEDAALADYLRNEHPQTVALVLSRLQPAQVARVLAKLPDEFAVETIMRMLRLEEVQPEVLADVERTLLAEFLADRGRIGRRDGHEAMAEIFNHFDRATESRLMAGLEERDREAAERIRASMFTFEDLGRLDGPGIQLLIRNAGNARIAVALKGASDQIKNLFFSNMSERAAKILREEMEAMGPIRLRDVEEAQQFLVNMAKELAAAGEIFLADGKEEQMVY